jgi:hypothetical protein
MLFLEKPRFYSDSPTLLQYVNLHGKHFSLHWHDFNAF